MLGNDDEDDTVLLRLRREFDDIKDLVARSIECDVMEMSEAAWNTDVHMPLLHLALRGSPAVGAYNMFVNFLSFHPCSRFHLLTPNLDHALQNNRPAMPRTRTKKLCGRGIRG